MPEQERTYFTIAIVAVSFASLFSAYFLSPIPENASLASLQLVYDNAASVISMGAAIPANEYNTLAKQLEERSSELSARERELSEREATLSSGVLPGSAETARLVYVLGGVVLLLLLLILVNFYLDWKRTHHSADPSEVLAGSAGPISGEGPIAHNGELTTRL